MFNKDVLDKYVHFVHRRLRLTVKLSNGKVGRVIRIRSQLRGKVVEVEVNPSDNEYKYELAALDKEQALTDARFKNLLHIVEVIGEKITI